mgnify:FL=1
MKFTKDFKEILIDFFSKYDEINLKQVPEIIKRYRQNKEDVIVHLCNRYKVDINTIEGIEIGKGQTQSVRTPSEKPAAGKGGGPRGKKPSSVPPEKISKGEENEVLDEGKDKVLFASDEPFHGKKKKSKTLLLVIIIVVIGLVIGGWFMKDSILGMFGKGGKHTEEAVTKSDNPAPAEDQKPDATAKPEAETGNTNSSAANPVAEEESPSKDTAGVEKAK